MRTRFFAHHLLSLLISFSLILTPAASNAQPLGGAANTPLPSAGEGPGVRATAPQRPAPSGDLALYRTHITVDSLARRARRAAAGVASLGLYLYGVNELVILFGLGLLVALAQFAWPPLFCPSFYATIATDRSRKCVGTLNRNDSTCAKKSPALSFGASR